MSRRLDQKWRQTGTQVLLLQTQTFCVAPGLHHSTENASIRWQYWRWLCRARSSKNWRLQFALSKTMFPSGTGLRISNLNFYSFNSGVRASLPLGADSVCGGRWLSVSSSAWECCPSPRVTLALLSETSGPQRHPLPGSLFCPVFRHVLVSDRPMLSRLRQLCSVFEISRVMTLALLSLLKTTLADWSLLRSHVNFSPLFFHFCGNFIALVIGIELNP